MTPVDRSWLSFSLRLNKHRVKRRPISSFYSEWQLITAKLLIFFTANLDTLQPLSRYFNGQWTWIFKYLGKALTPVFIVYFLLTETKKSTKKSNPDRLLLYFLLYFPTKEGIAVGRDFLSLGWLLYQLQASGMLPLFWPSYFLCWLLPISHQWCSLNLRNKRFFETV